MNSAPDSDWEPSPARALLWAVIAIFTLSGTFFFLHTLGYLGSVTVDRVAITQSRQYAATNTDAFYTRLEAIRKIDVQIADPATDPSLLPGLTSQRELLEAELHREVAKIPADARTADMIPYGGR